MKKGFFFLMGMLCSFLGVMGQDPYANSLKVGDTVPDILFRNMVNFHKKEAKLSDFKGKLVILDFWATWCAPCVAGMPKLDSLQKKFKDKLQIIGVSSEENKTVENFFKKRNQLGIPSNSVHDTSLRSKFVFHIVPHTVWINENRVIIAITLPKYVTEKNISTILSGASVSLPLKKDLFNDITQPLATLENGEEKGGNTFYQVMVRRRLEGASGSFSFTKDENNKQVGFSSINTCITNHFIMAFQKPVSYRKAFLVLEVQDSSRYLNTNPTMDIGEWEEKNVFCFDIIAPHMNQSEQYYAMQKALNAAFKSLYGLTASIAKREVLCYVIKRTNDEEKFKTTGKRKMRGSLKERQVSIMQNVSMNEFTEGLCNSFEVPFVNETNYTNNIDFEIPSMVINDFRKTKDIKELKNLLNSYGLGLEREPRMVEVLLFQEELPRP